MDEIKQDISSFRYEMLNHISVRQMETMENKDRLDRLFGKLDTVLLHQKQLLRAVAAGAQLHEDSVVTQKSSLSTNTDSSVSSASTGSVTTDEEEDTSATGVARFKKATSSVKSMKKIPEEFTRRDTDNNKISPSKKDGNLIRQEGFGSSVEEDTFTEAVEVMDVRVRVMTSPNHKVISDDRL